MIRTLDPFLALGLAAGLHVAVFVALPDGPGGHSGGDEGTAQITLAATAAGVASLVQTWTAPPDIVPDVALPQSSKAAPPPDISLLNLPPSRQPPSANPKVPQASSALPKVPQPLRHPKVSKAPNVQAPGLAKPAATITSQSTTPRSSALLRAPAPSAAESLPSADFQTFVTPDRISPRPVLRPAHFAKLAPKTTSNAASSTAQRAKRADGHGASAKTSKGASGNTNKHVQKTNQASLKARWAAQIRAKVSRNMFAPRGAIASTPASVAFSVSTSGKLLGLELVSSSGSKAFDRAALSAVKRARRFPKAPGGMSNSSYRFTFSPRIE